MTDLDTSLETERRLRLEAEERLRRANADFQEFATRIAHDLREPLRTVSSYCQLLANRFGNADDEDAALFLRYIHDAVERAQTLMAGVVEYSTIEGEQRRPASVDLNAVVSDAARRAGQDHVHPQGNLPAVIGDYGLLVNVMRHLFDNAMKFASAPTFSSPSPPAARTAIASSRSAITAPASILRIRSASSVSSGGCTAASILARAWAWPIAAKPSMCSAAGCGSNPSPEKAPRSCSASPPRTEYGRRPPANVIHNSS